jgi:hypothetical protein
MTTLGSDNWIKYGWGTEMVSHYTIGDRLHIDFSNCTNKKNIPAMLASSLAVDDIVEHYPAPYTLMCSGGVDSQAMIWAWHNSKIPFTVLSVKYISDNIWFNEHDLRELNVFCELYNIPIRYETFDILSFLENNLADICIKYDCDSPQIATHIKITEFVSHGTVMFSGNTLPHSFSHTLLSMHRYGLSLEQQTSIKIVPFFLCHTPSLAYSFIRPSDARIGYLGKVDTYISNSFPVIPQASSFNGFEELKKYYDQFFYNRITPVQRLHYSSKPSNRTFDHLFRHPYQFLGNNKSRLPPKNIFSQQQDR